MSTFVTQWAKAQGYHDPTIKDMPVFYRNLDAELDMRRSNKILMRPHVKGTAVDFSSGDSLALLSSGALKRGILKEFADAPNDRMTVPGSRLTDGNSMYIEQLEKEIAEFHGAETALVVNSGCVGNLAIYSTIPLAGDVIVYDELIHASIHDGLKNSVARSQRPFRHNDVESFSEALLAVLDTEPQIRNGTRSVIVSIESVYSMDGDICPLQELVDTAKEILPAKNAVFIIDEAYGTGILGPKGSGLVCELGLEKEIAIRMHTFPKALGSTGSAILANHTVKMMLMNNARALMFTGVPSFPMLASIRAAYGLLKSGQTIEAQNKVHHLVRLFLKKMRSHPVWERANDAGIMRIPLYEGDENPAMVTQIVPVWTRTGHSLYLAFHVNQAGYSGHPVLYPVVPKGQERVRFIFQSQRTDEEVEKFAECICEWAEEMLEIEESGDRNRLPTATVQAYAQMEAEKTSLA
ncbi:class II aminotransferase/8-amino-7-oxononanoate synthase [Trichoderma barbatum]